MEHSISGRISVKSMVMVGMFAAFLAVMSQISLPMPTGVPITIQVFAVALVGVVLGWKLGLAAVVVYILIGAVGAPVFANFQGGIQIIAGTAGGYILSWPVMTALCGIRPRLDNSRMNLAVNIVLALIGLAICEGAGALQWALLTEGDLRAILIYSFTAFIPKDIVLTVLAVVVGRQVRRLVERAGGM